MIQRDRRGFLEKMIGQGSLPTLLDTYDAPFADAYAPTADRALHFFDRKGCLVPNEIPTGKKVMADLDETQAILRDMGK